MNFSIDVLDGFHVDVLVEKVAQAVKVLETDQPFNVFNFSGGCLLFTSPSPTDP